MFLVSTFKVVHSIKVRQLRMTGWFVWEQVSRLAGSWSFMSFVLPASISSV